MKNPIIDEFKKIGRKKIKSDNDKKHLVALHSIILDEKLVGLKPRYARYPLKSKRLEIDKSVGLKKAREIARDNHTPYRDTFIEETSLVNNYIFTN